MSDVDVATEEEAIVSTAKSAPAKSASKPRPKRQPQYTVIVLDDDLHTYNYVVNMLSRICGHSHEEAYRLAFEIDTTGLAAVWSGSMEVAELKRDQILAYLPDDDAENSVTFPMGCYIEPLA